MASNSPLAMHYNKLAGFLAVFSGLFFSGCAVSEDRSAAGGAVTGAAVGGTLANIFGKGDITGSRTGDTLLGSLVGGSLGSEAGRSASTLKGTKKTVVPKQ